jgi:hypothetical protein
MCKLRTSLYEQVIYIWVFHLYNFYFLGILSKIILVARAALHFYNIGNKIIYSANPTHSIITIFNFIQIKIALQDLVFDHTTKSDAICRDRKYIYFSLLNQEQKLFKNVDLHDLQIPTL